MPDENVVFLPSDYSYWVEYSHEDQAFIARVVEFPSLVAHALTTLGAVAELGGVVAVVLDDLSDSSETIPVPILPVNRR